MLNANPSVGRIPNSDPNKKTEIPKGGASLYIFNGTNNININGDNPDDISWLLG